MFLVCMYIFLLGTKVIAGVPLSDFIWGWDKN